MKKVLLLLMVLLFVQFEATAQINPLKRAQRKLEERLAKKAADKIEKAIDKKIDEKIEEKEGNPDEKRNRSIYDLEKIMGTGTPIDLPDSYDFNFQIDWRITSSDSKTPTKMIQLFSEDELLIGIEFEGNEKGRASNMSQIVIDIEKSYLIMLDQDNSRAMVIQMDDLESRIEKEIEKDAKKTEETRKLIKTNETKTIAGYPCVKYISKGEGKEMAEMWATTELSYDNINMYSYFKGMARKKNVDQKAAWNKGVEGFVLEMDMVDEKGRETHMTATKVDKNANRSFDISEYESMDMRGYSKMMDRPKEKN